MRIEDEERRNALKSQLEQEVEAIKQSIAVTSPENGFDFNMTQPGQYEFEVEVVNARGQIIHQDVTLAVLDH